MHITNTNVLLSVLTEVGHLQMSGKGQKFKMSLTNELEKRVASLEYFRGMGEYVITRIFFSMKPQDTFFSLQKACLQELVKMIYLLCLCTLWKLVDRMSVPPSALASATLSQREWLAMTDGESNGGAWCWCPEGLSHCISSAPSWWALYVLWPNLVCSSHTCPLCVTGMLSGQILRHCFVCWRLSDLCYSYSLWNILTLSYEYEIASFGGFIFKLECPHFRRVTVQCTQSEFVAL